MINDNVYIVLNNFYNMTIDNNASNSMILIGTGSNVISESNSDSLFNYKYTDQLLTAT